MSPAVKNFLWNAGRVVFWSAAVVFAYELCRRSITLGDEGYILSQAAAILDGKVPYRDLDLFVTPGVWYLIAALFSIAGPKVIVTRWATACCLLATMYVSRRIVSEVAGPRWADLAPALLAVFAVWAFPAWSFSFYSPWATMFALVALASVLAWIRTRRSAWLFFCGVACGLCFVFKQNYGVYAAAGSALGIALDLALARPAGSGWAGVFPALLRAGLVVTAGVLVPVLPLLYELVSSGAMAAAWDSLVLRPFQGFMDAHSIPYLEFSDVWSFAQMRRSAGFVYEVTPMNSTTVAMRWPWLVGKIELLNWGLYWMPPALFAGMFARAWTRARNPSPADRALAALNVFAAVYFLGVFPRADLNHLINVYQPVLCLAVASAGLLFGTEPTRWTRLRSAGALASALLVACYTLVAALWLNDIRKIYNFPIASDRGGVLVPSLDAALINEEIASIRKLSEPGEAVFAIPGLSMLPFLADRPMPTRYYNYYSVHIGHDKGSSAAEEIESSHAKLVVADYSNFFSDPVGMLRYAPELTDYLNRNFQPLMSTSNQRRLYMVRREEPLPRTPYTQLLQYCDITPGRTASAVMYEHLLFRTIYHSFARAWGTRNQLITLCQLKVPENAMLRFSLEMRQLAPATTGKVTMTAQIWLWPDEGAPEQLFQEERALATELTWSAAPPQGHTVDLSGHEGQIVTLMLRTRLDGPVPSEPSDLFGLSLMWDDARIESPQYGEGWTPREKTEEETPEEAKLQKAERDDAAPTKPARTPPTTGGSRGSSNPSSPSPRHRSASHH